MAIPNRIDLLPHSAPSVIWHGLYDIYRACGGLTSNLSNLILDYSNCKNLHSESLKYGQACAIFSFDIDHYMTNWTIDGDSYSNDCILSKGYDISYKIKVHDYAEYVTFEKICKNV